MQSRRFHASLDWLHEMLQWIRLESAKIGFDASNLIKIELAAEEAIVNVIHHSYSDRGGEIEIAIDATADRQLHITIYDRGIAFNPLIHELKEDLDAPLEEREIGGLGIHFMRKCLDEVRYQRKNDRNILTLIKNY